MRINIKTLRHGKLVAHKLTMACRLLQNLKFNSIWLACSLQFTRVATPPYYTPLLLTIPCLAPVGIHVCHLWLRFQSIAISVGINCCYGYWNRIMQSHMCSTEGSHWEQGKLYLDQSLFYSSWVFFFGFSEGHLKMSRERSHRDSSKPCSLKDGQNEK
jgi:hypothetical protein